MKRTGCSLVEKQGKSLKTLEILLLLFCGAIVRKKPSTFSYTTKTVEDVPLGTSTKFFLSEEEEESA